MDLMEEGKNLAQSGKYAEALAVFKKALEKDGSDPDLLFFIGACYSALGDFGAAKYLYQEVLKIDPNHHRTRKVWAGLEEVEARPPQDLRLARSRATQIPDSAGAESISTGASARPADTTREPADKWAEAFPGTTTRRQPRKGVLGVWVWVLITLAVAALVYFVIGPRYLTPGG